MLEYIEYIMDDGVATANRPVKGAKRLLQKTNFDRCLLPVAKVPRIFFRTQNVKLIERPVQQMAANVLSDSISGSGHGVDRLKAVKSLASWL